ncbi:MAG: HpcH/HpaI aldolase/citrate lyase family protein [Candidatus Binatia bacterium]
MEQATGSASPRPIRTGLLVAAGSEGRVRSALESGADAVYLDLESVAPQELPGARALVRRIVSERRRRPLLLVRVNAPHTGVAGDDLEAAVAPGLYGIALPKIDGPADVAAIDDAVGSLEARAGLPAGGIVMHPIIETAQAVRRAYRIARASTRVAHMGGVAAPRGDLARALGFEWTAEGLETLYVRSKVLVDARAAGVLYPMSGMAPVEDDLEEARGIALAARRLGYEGMLLGYPSHVEVVNAAFTPGVKEIEHWRAIVEAGREAAERGGEAVFRRRRLDPETVRSAERSLERARALGLVE